MISDKEQSQQWQSPLQAQLLSTSLLLIKQVCTGMVGAPTQGGCSSSTGSSSLSYVTNQQQFTGQMQNEAG